MVEYLDAPIQYDRERNGYYYASGKRFELPGLWFTPSELYALLAAEQLLEQSEPGLFSRRLKPLETRIRQIIRGVGLDPSELRSRIRLTPLAQRRRESKTLGAVTEALLNRRRLHFTYRSRSHDRKSERYVSPQRLVRYRDNWFLDAWCHSRKAVRTFALDRIGQAKAVDEPCREVPTEKLEQLTDESYGIFAGPPRHQAILRFSGFAARWVADETWHVDQKGQWLLDGRYELEVPYADHRELLMDVQRFGPEVEVVGPAKLRRLMIERLDRARGLYG